MAFSIRDLTNPLTYSATLYVNGMPTMLTAIIINGSLNYGIIGTGYVLLNELDLITILITTTNGALSNGVCITLAGGLI